MKWYFLLFFFVMFILIVGSYFFFREEKTITKQKTEQLQFLPKTLFTDILLQDKDDYYKTFHKNDLKIRNSQSVDDYKKIIQSSTCNGTQKLKKKITRCINMINDKLHSKTDETIHGIHIGTFLDIPWKIGFTCDEKYEAGYPHTRGDVIVLNVSQALQRTEGSLCKLLVHEKTHVYQKLHKNQMDQYLTENGYKIVDQKTKRKTDIPANPDIDSNIYDHLETKFKYYARYRKKPISFQDIEYSNDSPQNEHPLEKIAYDMENIL